jgi:uridylate kinase
MPETERNSSRYIVKVSGELFSNKEDDISFSRYDAVAKQIIEIVKNTGIQLAMVVGGGNIFRGREKSEYVDSNEADSMGMMATIINGIALREAFIRNGAKDTRLMTTIHIPELAEPYIRLKAKHHLDEDRLVILAGGLGKPGFSTDSAVAQFASELACDLILKASTVDGVYDSDPKKNDQAKKITSTELTLKQIARKLAKMNGVTRDKLEVARELRSKIIKNMVYAGTDSGELMTDGLVDAEKVLGSIKNQSEEGCKVIIVDNITVFKNQGNWKTAAKVGQQMVSLTKTLESAVIVVAHTIPSNVAWNEKAEGLNELIATGREEEMFDRPAVIMLRPSTKDIYGGGGFSSQFDKVILFWRPLQKFDQSHLNSKVAIIIDSDRDSAEAKGSNLIRLDFNSETEIYKEKELDSPEQTSLNYKTYEDAVDVFTKK